MDAGAGYYVLKSFGRVLFIRSFGSWDDRTALSFAEDVREMIEREFKAGPWCVIHDAREWQLGVPEMEKIISGFVSSAITGRLSRHAMVTGDSELKKWQIDRMFASLTAYPHRRFDTIQEAREWLISDGFTIPDLPD